MIVLTSVLEPDAKEADNIDASQDCVRALHTLYKSLTHGVSDP